jgi:hypothetical protein
MLEEGVNRRADQTQRPLHLDPAGGTASSGEPPQPTPIVA